MKTMVTMFAAAMLSTGAMAQDAENDSCPISGRAVAASAPTATHDGHTIGFCCGGCAGKFDGWDKQRKDGFVLTLASAATSTTTTGFEGDAYVLQSCPISGKPLGADAVVKTISDREVRFCCNGCVEPFSADAEASFATLDKKIAKDQMAYYPLKTCIISGEPLFEEGKDVGVNAVYRNRLVRLCCSDCKKKFMSDPAPYIAKLDAAVIAAQSEAYPIETCPIGKGELGSMGEPSQIVLANRLVKFCCAMCEPKLIANPTEFIATLDAAWKEKGMPWAEDAERLTRDKPRVVGSN